MTPPLSPPNARARAQKSRFGRLRAAAALVCALALLSALGSTSPASAIARPAPSAAQAGETNNWPQWRGPLGNGVSPASDAPVHFSATQGVKWKVAVPGRGQSSPVVWNDLVFVTTAVPVGDAAVPEARLRRRRQRLVAHEFRVIAFRRADGIEAWTRTATITVPNEGHHPFLSSYANASPVTDGERVYASFGSRGLYAYDLDGGPLWSRQFDVQVETYGAFGEASSPALHGDTLVVVFDHQGQSFIEAVDSSTGATRWKQLRDEDTSWSSPYIVEHQGRALAVASGGKFVTAYDLESGAVVWRVAGMTPRPIPTPVAAGGLLFAASGSAERTVQAISLGTADAAGAGTVVWQLDKAAPYNPSPLLWGDELYLVRDGGLDTGTSRLSMIHASSGEPVYLQEGLPGNYTIKASPVAAGDRLYLATEEGDILIIRRGPDPEVLAVNEMGEPFIASPAIAHGELFLRGRDHLFCISGTPR